MKIKKLLSTIAALAIAASSFAGLGITANAAINTGDTADSIGSWTAYVIDATNRVNTVVTAVEATDNDIAHNSIAVSAGNTGAGVYQGCAHIGINTAGNESADTITSGVRIAEVSKRYHYNSKGVSCQLGDSAKSAAAWRGMFALVSETYATNTDTTAETPVDSTGTLTINVNGTTGTVNITEGKWYDFIYVADYSSGTDAKVSVYCSDGETTTKVIDSVSASNYALYNIIVTAVDKNTSGMSMDFANEAIYTVGVSESNTIEVSCADEDLTENSITKDQLDTAEITFTAAVKHNATDNVDISGDIANTTWTVADADGNAVTGAEIENGVLTLGSNMAVTKETGVELVVTAARGTITDTYTITVVNNAASDLNYYPIAFAATDKDNSTKLNPAVKVFNASGDEVADWATAGLQKGTYTYTATLDTYASIENAEFTVTGESLEVAQNIAFTMTENKYNATVTALPHSKVTVSGKSTSNKDVNDVVIYTDKTGTATLNTYVGTYDVSVAKTDYTTATGTVDVNTTATGTVALTIEPVTEGVVYYEDFANTGVSGTHLTSPFIANMGWYNNKAVTVSTSNKGVGTYTLPTSSYNTYTVNIAGLEAEASAGTSGRTSTFAITNGTEDIFKITTVSQKTVSAEAATKITLKVAGAEEQVIATSTEKGSNHNADLSLTIAPDGTITGTWGEVALNGNINTVDVSEIAVSNVDSVASRICLNSIKITGADVPAISSVVTVAPKGMEITAPETVTDAADSETTVAYADLTDGKVVTTVYVKVDNATEGVAPVVTFNEFEDPAQATYFTTADANGYFVYQIIADTAVTVKSVTYTGAADYTAE